jgi:hypothetical protein
MGRRLLRGLSTFGSLFAQFQTFRGYRIAAIMPPCQGGDGGSTPPTRSNKTSSFLGGRFVLGRVFFLS